MSEVQHDRLQQAEEVFAAWLERRAADPSLSIEGLCADHPALADELRRMHGGWRRLTPVFAALAPSAAPLAPERDANGGPADEALQATLARLAQTSAPWSRYRIEGELGRGGMGVVLAVWDEALARRLALKRALPATSTASTHRVSRFLEEARITGSLEHPGIVPVHDVGLDPQGRPFFTMPRIEGRSLGEVFALARQNREGWSQTRALDVLLRACEAVAYAHSRGVIHRDLKPANIMVGRFGEVHVLDWGLARAGRAPDDAHPGGHEREPRGYATATGDVLGTAWYVAPEQARGEHERVGPRSDVYSLGAILYHLLSGRAPYEQGGSRTSQRAAWSRVLAGPPPPLSVAAPGASPELVAICERAMARESEERYGDVGALIEDLRAYLETRVVKAYRTGAVAELSKWIRRNRLAAAALFLAVLLLGVVAWVEGRGRRELGRAYGDLEQANRALSAANADARRSAEAALASASEARAERDSAERIAESMAALFRASRPDEARGAEPTARELLDRGAERLRFERGQDPRVRLRLLEAIAGAYRSLGAFASAEPLDRERVALAAEVHGPQSLPALVARGDLALTIANVGRLAEGERELRGAIEGLERFRAADAEEEARAANALGSLLIVLGDLKRAEPVLRRALDLCRTAPGTADARVLPQLNNLATVLASRRRYEEAEALMREGCEIGLALRGEDHPDTLTQLGNLAFVIEAQGRHAEALEIDRRVLEVRERVQGPEHPETLRAMDFVAHVARAAGDAETAENVLRETLARARRTRPMEHPITLQAAVALGIVLRERCQGAEAAEILCPAFEACERTFGERHPRTLDCLDALVRAQEDAGDLAAAASLGETLVARTAANARERKPREALLARLRGAGTAR